jgi:hypothetical protein
MENVSEKMRKLFAKANDSSVTEEEALSYMNKVQELLAKHNLDMSSLEEKEEDIKMDKTILETPYGHIKWRRDLMCAVAKLFFCKGYILQGTALNSKGKVKDTNKFVFAGHEHNRQIAISMFEYLCKSVVRLSRDFSSDTNTRYHFEQGCGYRLTIRVYNKIDETNQPYQNGEKNNLPALYSTELSLVDDFLSDNKFKTMQNRRLNANNITMAGYRAADGISLNNQVGNNSTVNKFLLK